MRRTLLHNTRPWSCHKPHGNLPGVSSCINFFNNTTLSFRHCFSSLSNCSSFHVSSLEELALNSSFTPHALSLHMTRRHVHGICMQRHGVGFDIAAFVKLLEEQKELQSTRVHHKPNLENENTISLPSSQQVEESKIAKDKCGIEPELQKWEAKQITIRGRVSHTRIRGKLSFIELRQPPFHSIQIVCNSPSLTQQVKQLNVESIIEVKGQLVKAHNPIQSTTCSTHEVQAEKIIIISSSNSPLPFPLNDVHAKLDTRLNYRSVDLRTRANVAMVQILSMLSNSFRENLIAKEFVEIHTPKLIASSSEGGSAVFSVNYFTNNNNNNTELIDSPDINNKNMESTKNTFNTTSTNEKDDVHRFSYLAQSPQLYKQMMINGDAMRVFEIGPVFRAENSLTHRHLTEFTGVDFEMVIMHSYVEILNVLEEVMCNVLGTIQSDANVLELLVPACAGLCKRESNTNQNIDNDNKELTNEFHRVVCEVPADKIHELGIVEEEEEEEETGQEINDGENKYNTLHTIESGKVDKYHARVRRIANESEKANCDDAKPFASRVLRMSFVNAKQMLADYTATQSENDTTNINNKEDDFTLMEERQLGKLIKARYGVDLYVIDQFPLSARPFYTMPLNHSKHITSQSRTTADDNHKNKKNETNNNKCNSGGGECRQYSCSFDMYLRGEEICSGAQRQHDAELLQDAIESRGLTHELNLQHYIDSFKYGAWPHGGAGLGLERIALFLLDAYDIRQVSLFPRDPKRLTPENLN